MPYPTPLWRTPSSPSRSGAGITRGEGQDPGPDSLKPASSDLLSLAPSFASSVLFTVCLPSFPPVFAQWGVKFSQEQGGTFQGQKGTGLERACFGKAGSWGSTEGMSSVANRIGHVESSVRRVLLRPRRLKVRITETQERGGKLKEPGAAWYSPHLRERSALAPPRPREVDWPARRPAPGILARLGQDHLRITDDRLSSEPKVRDRH